jgi:diguanylate cyclase (GGDEF)-like protein
VVSLALLLPWFPVLLGVGMGGRLLGRSRGLALGVLCALFWLLVIRSSAGPGLWKDGWALASAAAGMFAIIAIGAWAGETGAIRNRFAPVRRDPTGIMEGSLASKSELESGRAESTVDSLTRLSEAMDQFDDFVEDNRLVNDPWPAFGEFMRRVLYQNCQATHVRPYRLVNEGRELAPLIEVDSSYPTKRLGASDGLIGEVLATGRAYLEGGGGQAVAGSSSASVADGRAAWCFPIRHGVVSHGVVVVGQLGIVPQDHVRLLETSARLISQFWLALQEMCRSRDASVLDPATGVLTREALLASAESSLAESYGQSEPASVAVVALEGLRELNDSGRWEVVDQLLREIGQSLRGKLRLDDRLGRFDGSRFVILMRRVDADLSMKIVGQMLAKLDLIAGDSQRWRKKIVCRAGVACSGDDRPDLRTLVSRALTLCHLARVDQQPFAHAAAGALAVAGTCA